MIHSVNMDARLLHCRPVIQPRFACRMMAFVSEGDNNPSEHASLRKKFLITSRNSLINQSKPNRPRKDGTREIFDITDLSGTLRRVGNPDGWGIISYLKGQMKQISRSPFPAFKDKGYEAAVEQASNQATLPETVLAHVRLGAPACNQVTCENAHPFIYQNWSFMHNGFADGSLTPQAKSETLAFQQRHGVGPAGTTDSEHALFLFLNMLEKAYPQGNLESRNIGEEAVAKVFGDFVARVIRDSSHQSKSLDGSLLGLEGNLEMAPSCNFVTTDGNMLLAYRRGAKLYLGVAQFPDGEREIILASEPTTVSRDLANVQWVDIPNDHGLMVTHDPDDKLKIKFFSPTQR